MGGEIQELGTHSKIIPTYKFWQLPLVEIENRGNILVTTELVEIYAFLSWDRVWLKFLMFSLLNNPLINESINQFSYLNFKQLCIVLKCGEKDSEQDYYKNYNFVIYSEIYQIFANGKLFKISQPNTRPNQATHFTQVWHGIKIVVNRRYSP